MKFAINIVVQGVDVKEVDFGIFYGACSPSSLITICRKCSKVKLESDYHSALSSQFCPDHF